MNKLDLISLDIGRDSSIVGRYPNGTALYNGKEISYKISKFLDGISRSILHGPVEAEPDKDRYWTGEMKKSSGYPRYFTLYLKKLYPPEDDPYDYDYDKYNAVLAFYDTPQK